MPIPYCNSSAATGASVKSNQRVPGELGSSGSPAAKTSVFPSSALIFGLSSPSRCRYVSCWHAETRRAVPQLITNVRIANPLFTPMVMATPPGLTGLTARLIIENDQAQTIMRRPARPQTVPASDPSRCTFDAKAAT